MKLEQPHPDIHAALARPCARDLALPHGNPERRGIERDVLSAAPRHIPGTQVGRGGFGRPVENRAGCHEVVNVRSVHDWLGGIGMRHFGDEVTTFRTVKMCHVCHLNTSRTCQVSSANDAFSCSHDATSASLTLTPTEHGQTSGTRVMSNQAHDATSVAPFICAHTSYARRTDQPTTRHMSHEQNR